MNTDLLPRKKKRFLRGNGKHIICIRGNKMKKLLTIIFAVLMTACLFVAVACAGEAGDASTQTSDSSVTVSASAGENEQSANSGAIVDSDEYQLAKEDGCNQLTVYWNYKGTQLDKCDLWVWWEDKEGSGYLFHECNFGAKCVVNVPDAITEVGFIVRKSCSDPGGVEWGTAVKDYDGDRVVKMDAEEVKIYLKTGDGNIYYSDDNGATLYQRLEITFAQMIDFNTIRYNISPANKFTDKSQFSISCDGKQLAITSVTGLNTKLASARITVDEKLSLERNYELTIEGYGSAIVVPTTVFDTEEFKENFLYDGDDLGANVSGVNTTFKVWAPTASKVVLNLFENGNEGDAYKSVYMTKGAKGVWSVVEQCGHGTYYTYTVTTSVGTQTAVDPYAKAAGVNGNRGMVVDLEQTDPANWLQEKYYDGLTAYSDAIIWETHVRDFSNAIATSKYKGKYLAFTETGLKNSSGVSVGIDYLKNLGITHVHLNPVYDFATVDETGSGNQYNWGYDPKNYNVPEGSYSTDPYNGAVRVGEFKQMVQALHAAGIGVIMDVVYNHTYDGNSYLNKIVPYYYYRYTTSGANSNGSGCGNETASEREMFRKYMVDSVTYWATEYMIDGFRFDLMGLHDVTTMQEIEKAVHAINPQAIIYGEGWTGGTSTLSTNQQMTTANAKKVTASEGAIGAVAVFNDVTRDGLKGSVFDAAEQGYGNGNPTTLNAHKVEFGLKGGTATTGVSWSTEVGNVINYVSCHDNYTLYDKLVRANPKASEAEILAINKFCASVIMLSRGAPFMLAGEEMLRTKQGDENSYKSSDAINNIDWDALTVGSNAYELYEFYKALIAFRKANDFIRHADVDCLVSDGFIQATYYVNGEYVGKMLINPYATERNYYVSGEYTLIFDGEKAVNIGNVSINTIRARSVVVYR